MRQNQVENNITSERQSNFELMRIAAMLLVIAHHYVVSSGIMESFNFDQITANMVFLQFFGAFGKVAINCFLLVTGYFMIHANWSMKKWFRLYLEIKFYKILLYFIVIFTGYAPFDYHELLITLFSTLFGIGEDYAETYLLLYLLIPFINILIRQISKQQYQILLGILLTVFCLVPSFSIFLSVKYASNDTWNYLIWMITVYLFGAYLRLYPVRLLDNQVCVSITVIANILLIFTSILVVDFIGVRFDFSAQYWFVNDANKLLALSSAVAIFSYFKNLKIRYSKLINATAATTFGVFLVHTNNEYIRQYIWEDLVKCSEYYHSNLLVLNAVISTLLVFLVCSFIDVLRSRLFKHTYSLFSNKNQLR